jgi:hypothetical protein
MNTDDGGHRDAAVAALSTREYERAGDEYTRAAWRVLADPRSDRDPFAADERGYVGVGLSHLVTAAVAYRVAGRPSRATRRGVEGVAVARDLENALAHPVQRACLAEFVADCRVAGGLDGADEQYEEAATAYREAVAGGDDGRTDLENPTEWTTRPLFEAAAAPLQQVARGSANGEIAVAWEDLHGADPGAPGQFLAHRATYKRQRFPGLVERAVADGLLAAPRGTTEYDTDHHRCPDCGSTDVNWVADSTLCLRCSRPTDPR